jgi:hypothetical protein
MLTIDPNSWHARVYFWWYRRKYGYPNEGKRSNLCPYLRAVLFWAPFRALFSTWVTVKRVPVNVVTIPAVLYAVPTLLGYLSYRLKFDIWLVYLIVVAIAALFAISFAFDKDGLGWAEKCGIEDFLDLTGEYLRAAHDGICPEVCFRDPADLPKDAPGGEPSA